MVEIIFGNSAIIATHLLYVLPQQHTAPHFERINSIPVVKMSQWLYQALAWFS